MDRDAREAKAMTKELPVKDRMANFWYYKKWWIIGIAAALIVVAITVFEIVNRKGVVHDQRHAVGVSSLGKFLDIQHSQGGVGNGLAEHHLGVGPESVV